jgi:hypothetical protein
MKRRPPRRVPGAVHFALAVIACLVSGCSGPACVAYRSAPAARRVVANLPAQPGGGEALQDHRGAALPVVSGYSGPDFGGEQVPTPGHYGGAATWIDGMDIPNGGERPLESLAAFPSPPCAGPQGQPSVSP